MTYFRDDYMCTHYTKHPALRVLAALCVRPAELLDPRRSASGFSLPSRWDGRAKARIPAAPVGSGGRGRGGKWA